MDTRVVDGAIWRKLIVSKFVRLNASSIEWVNQGMEEGRRSKVKWRPWWIMR